MNQLQNKPESSDSKQDSEDEPLIFKIYRDLYENYSLMKIWEIAIFVKEKYGLRHSQSTIEKVLGFIIDDKIKSQKKCWVRNTSFSEIREEIKRRRASGCG